MASVSGFRESDSVPFLACPFEGNIHRESDKIDANVFAWALSHKLAPTPESETKLLGSKIGTLLALCFPNGSVKGVELAAKVTIVFCVLDDHIENNEKLVGACALGQLFSQLALSLRSGSTFTGGAIESALIDIRFDIMDMYSEELLTSFSLSFEEQLCSAYIWEQINRQNDVRLNLTDYRKIRIGTSALNQIFMVGVLSEGCFLPSDVLLKDARFSELINAASCAVGYENDIHTYKRELNDGEIHNVIFVLMKHDESLSLQQALHEAILLHNVEIELVVKLSDSLTDSYPTDRHVSLFVAATQNCVAGHMEWLRSNARYDRN
jgi:hypothetical protein